MLQRNEMLGMVRATAKSATDMANVLLSGTERMLNNQAAISREIMAQYADAAKQIESAADLQALLAIQGKLARAQAEKAVTWWTDLYAEIGASQKELMRASQAGALAVIDGLSRTLEHVAPAPGTEPVVSAMKLVVNATRSSYAALPEAEPSAPATAPTAPTTTDTQNDAKQAAA